MDEYIAGFLPEIQEIMNAIRTTIYEIAPEVKEKISWGMPTFTMKKILVQFGGFKSHIGFFPGPAVIEAFSRELTGYKTSKGTIQFPYKNPLPLELIGKIIKYRIQEIA
ncbi:MAG: DUF1801 domain-containing protein [Prevotellaceae bacterium]|nr:DUF1801 domain-containing protein [Prevotellaceae bacterium]